MKTTTFLFALAISATLMITTTGCKHGRNGKDPIPGVTLVPKPGSETTGKNIGSGTDTLPPIKIESSTPTTGITSTPVEPVPGEKMAFDTNGPWAKVWDGPLTPDDKIFDKDKVYFELDSAVIRSSEQSKLQDIANYFKTDTNDVLMVEGHCDERGTEQYNMALGDRRALAVREYLANLGVEPGRIHTVSFGESRPVDPAHNEAAWSKNRRGVSILMRVGK